MAPGGQGGVLPAGARGAGSGRLPVALISTASASAAGPGVRATGAPRARVTGPGVTGQREPGPRGRPGRRPRAGATAGPWRRSRCRPRGASPGGGSVTAEPRRGSEAPLTSTFIFEGPQRRTGQPDVPGPLAGPVPSAQPRHGHGPIATVLRRTVCMFGCARY